MDAEASTALPEAKGDLAWLSGHPELTKRQAAFLAAYVEATTVTAAAESASVTRRCHSRWMASAAYRAAFAEASQMMTERLVAEARQRAEAARRAQWEARQKRRDQ